jgi:hypothetical protein
MRMTAASRSAWLSVVEKIPAMPHMRGVLFDSFAPSLPWSVKQRGGYLSMNQPNSGHDWPVKSNSKPPEVAMPISRKALETNGFANIGSFIRTLNQVCNFRR